MGKKDTITGLWRAGAKRLLRATAGVLQQHSLGAIAIEPALHADLVEARGDLLTLFMAERKAVEAELQARRLGLEDITAELEAMERPWTPAASQQLALPLDQTPANPGARCPAPDCSQPPLEVDLPEEDLRETEQERQSRHAADLLLQAFRSRDIEDEDALLAEVAEETGLELSILEQIIDEMTNDGRLGWRGDRWTAPTPEELAAEQAEREQAQVQSIQEHLRKCLRQGATQANACKQTAAALGYSLADVQACWPPPGAVQRGKAWVLAEEPTAEAVQAALLEGLRSGQTLHAVWTTVGERYGLTGLQVDRHWQALAEAGRVVWYGSTWREVAEVTR